MGDRMGREVPQRVPIRVALMNISSGQIFMPVVSSGVRLVVNSR